MEREYWRTASEGITLDDYPEIDDATVKFPDDIYIAYAVSHKACGHAEFIVDGSTQICDVCGKSMFRTAVRRYILAPVDAPPPPEAFEEQHGTWVEVDTRNQK